MAQSVERVLGGAGDGAEFYYRCWSFYPRDYDKHTVHRANWDEFYIVTVQQFGRDRRTTNWTVRRPGDSHSLIQDRTGDLDKMNRLIRGPNKKIVVNSWETALFLTKTKGNLVISLHDPTNISTHTHSYKQMLAILEILPKQAFYYCEVPVVVGPILNYINRNERPKHYTKDMTCRICFDRLKDDTYTLLNRCRHEYCITCILKWKSQCRPSAKCPTCRAEIDD